jgi:hypothetical protein
MVYEPSWFNQHRVDEVPVVGNCTDESERKLPVSGDSNSIFAHPGRDHPKSTRDVLSESLSDSLSESLSESRRVRKPSRACYRNNFSTLAPEKVHLQPRARWYA